MSIKKDPRQILMNINFHSFLFVLLFVIIPINSICTKGMKINDTSCFNDLIIIKNYHRAGSFATNKKGDMIIEYSNDHEGLLNKRLFYGIKKNGRYFFPNEEAYKEKEINNPVSTRNINARYEARNIFVSLEDDINKEKEYLFSTSAYETLTELHDLDSDSYKSRETIDFFDIIDIFSFEYSLFSNIENNKNVYYCIFTQHESDKLHIKRIINDQEKWTDDDYSKTFTIKKFGFTSYDLSSYNKIKSLNNTNNFNDRVISGFILKNFDIIVVFFMRKSDEDVKDARYAMVFYDLDLNFKNEINITDDNITEPRSGEGVFSKSLYLKEDYAAFVYFTKGYDETKIPFNILKFKKAGAPPDDDTYSYDEILTKDLEEIQSYCISDVALNDFIKVDDNRLVFLTTVRGEKIADDVYHFSLHIILMDLYETYTKMKIRHFYYDLSGHQIRKELYGYIYNGYLVFTSTVVTPQSYTSEDYFSFLMFFGYANGTDMEIDISPYLMDVPDYNSENNLYQFLMSKMRIDNNIFEYEKIDKINLVTIPDELLFYNMTDNIKDETKKIKNNDFFDSGHVLEQNRNINKIDKFYFLEYQYLVKEPEYSTFYNADKKDVVGDDNFEDIFNENRKVFYGRTNILKFKLCYHFCGSCIEFGTKIYDQKCLTCVWDYNYNYWPYVDKYQQNCVQENQFYDESSQNNIECDDTFKYFYPQEGKKICFKSELNCPDAFNKYDEDTKECKKKEIPPSTAPHIPSTIPYIPTTIPYNPTTILKNQDMPPSTIIKTVSESCSFDSYKNNNCSFFNESNSEILSKMRDLIYSFPGRGSSLVAEGEKGFAFKVSDTEKESKMKGDDNLTVINLGDCERKLKELYHITEPLLIIQVEQYTDKAYEKNVKYEVYNPITFDKLELSFCEDTQISLYIPVNLTEEIENFYQDMMDQGYDPFNINDRFYREICTPYTSENGTDVLLDDREEYIYSSIANETLCPENCEYSAYILDSKYLKCDCDINTTGIDTLDLHHLSGKNIYKSFLTTMKLSNYKVMICYNLVFNLKIFLHNYGSIGTLILFGLYVGFMIYYSFRGISSLKLNISKLIFESLELKKGELEIVPEEKYKNKPNEKRRRSTKYQHKNKAKIKYPPKRRNSKRLTKATAIKETEDVEFITGGDANDKQKPRKRSFKLKSKAEKNKINITPQIQNIKTSEDEMNEKENKEKEDKKTKQLNLDNFELNNLDYEEACDLDKRSCCATYCSVLMREHLFLFTFFSWNDYNIFYIKIERFFIQLCTDMTMNGLFFIHETMHRKYTENEDFTFVQKLPQLLFTLIVGHIIEVILCYFSMTDTAYYEIKALPKTKESQEQILNIIDCVKKKLVSFYVFTFLLFLFYWYFISAFCAVYQNTQVIFLRDSGISFLISFIDPFVIYAFTCLLRAISLSVCCKKKLCCIYKLSDLIPIF